MRIERDKIKLRAMQFAAALAIVIICIWAVSKLRTGTSKTYAIPDEYLPLAAALGGAGVNTCMQGPDHLVCYIGDLNAGPFESNSVWMMKTSKGWLIATWAPRYYSIPTDSDAVALCADVLRSSEETVPAIPDPLVQQYHLSEVAVPPK